MPRLDSFLCASCVLLVAAHASGAEPARSTRPPLPPARKVELGVDTGLARRPAQGGAATYGTGLAWGGHVRAPMATWLGFHATAMMSEHSVSFREGALGLPHTHVSQPDLSTLLVSARFEPTWTVTRRVSLWAGPEVSWARTAASEPTTRGELVIRTADRHGVGIELGGSVGAQFEVLPNWLVLGMSVGAFGVLDQGGPLYERVQGFDQKGHMLEVGPYPKHAGSFRTTVGFGVLL